MTVSGTQLSIFNAPPLETGGTAARQGFAFQDHVAAGFCIDLLTDDELTEVWCETQDDTTLIRIRHGKLNVEYVQSKNIELNQLWTVRLLCDRESKGISHSILEKSLAYDRCVEPCQFRLVTSSDIGPVLRVLAHPFTSPTRATTTDEMVRVHADVKKRVGDYKSRNGNCCDFWITNMLWDVRHDDEAVQNANIVKLTEALNGLDLNLLAEQVQELYSRLLGKVWDASLIDARVDPQAKRIKKTDFHAWLLANVNSISAPSAGADTAVRGKMEKALLAPDVILSALEQRRFYREEILNPQYLPLNDLKLIEREVAAVLHRLKSRLDKGDIPDDGVSFHDLCLAELDALRGSLPITPTPLLSTLQGCMYSIAGRCLHRFRRATG